jgi:hypothetical protein
MGRDSGFYEGNLGKKVALNAIINAHMSSRGILGAYMSS